MHKIWYQKITNSYKLKVIGSFLLQQKEIIRKIYESDDDTCCYFVWLCGRNSIVCT